MSDSKFSTEYEASRSGPAGADRADSEARAEAARDGPDSGLEEPRSDGDASGADSDSSASSGGEGEAETQQLPEEVRELLTLRPEELLELKRRADERDAYREELARAQADLDNHQKRVRRERPNWESHAVRKFVGDILPVLDNFELAVMSAEGVESQDAKNLRQGIELIYQMMRKTLEEAGVEEIRAEGETFDPEVHEAVATREVADRDSGEILEVQQRGYAFRGVVVRPSRVTVAARVESSGEEEGAGDDES